MNCQDAQLILLDGADDRGDRPRLVAAAAHAGACVECGRFVDELARMESALRVADEGTIEPPAGGYDAFADRLAASVRRPSRTFDYRWLAAAAVAAFCLTGSYYAGRSAAPNAPSRQVASVDPAVDAAAFSLSPADSRASAKAFTAVAAAFDRRAEWVWAGDKSADVGVGTAEPDRLDRVYIVKLVMRRAGQVVSRGELTVVAGRSAALRLPLEGGRDVHYRVDTPQTEREGVRITAELPTTAGSTAMLAADLPPRDGRTVRLGEMGTPDGDFELIAGVTLSTGGAP